jgi:hypothetical protein
MASGSALLVDHRCLLDAWRSSRFQFRLKAEVSRTVSAYSAIAVKEMIVNAIVTAGRSASCARPLREGPRQDVRAKIDVAEQRSHWRPTTQKTSTRPDSVAGLREVRHSLIQQ